MTDSPTASRARLDARQEVRRELLDNHAAAVLGRHPASDAGADQVAGAVVVDEQILVTPAGVGEGLGGAGVSERSGGRVGLAVGETVILLTFPPSLLKRRLIRERGVPQNGSLADG